ncbi:MAG TPA: hypothetical protein VJ732_19580 [Bryobacteraceae bacterium]|nr:hypothetical protein [Bryobacteraceae bacterium]
MFRGKHLAVWAIAPLAIFAETPQSREPAPSIGIYMDFDSVPGNASVQTMETEVSRLLKPSGVKLDWRLLRRNEGREAFSGLVVLKFRGRCKVEGWSQPPSEFGSMGETVELASTKVANGKVLPFTEVECDQVRKALAYLGPGADQAERQRALGIALGRVVAHELYHILARTTSHAARGLAEASASLRDLVTPGKLSFRQADSQAIGNAFRQP